MRRRADQRTLSWRDVVNSEPAVRGASARQEWSTFGASASASRNIEDDRRRQITVDSQGEKSIVIDFLERLRDEDDVKVQNLGGQREFLKGASPILWLQA